MVALPRGGALSRNGNARIPARAGAVRHLHATTDSSSRQAAVPSGGAPRLIACAASPQPGVKETPSDEALLSVVLKLKREIAQLKEENAKLRAEADASAKALVSAQAAPAATEAPARTQDDQADGEDASASDGEPHTGVYTLEQLEKAVRWPTKGQRFWQDPPRDPKVVLEDASPPGQAVIPRDASPMHVVHIAPELAPCAKVGGLGDVVQGLAKASMQRGHTVEVILPYYTSLPEAELEGLEHVADFECPKGEVWDGEMRQSSLASSVHRATIDGVPVVLIAPQNRKHSNLFVGDRIYGGSYNELEAYLYFCRASLETLRILRSPADVIHLHEWQCCAAAMLFWDVLYHDGLTQPRLVLTIHNMDNSGECRQDEFAVTGVPGEMFADIDKALDERTIGHNPERLNLMKGGIVYANAVTTVSPTYAEEARSGGAAGYLRTMINEPDILRKFYGILNGIDIDFWCPSNDPMIPAPYNSAAPAGKALCKRFVQQGLGLKEDAKRPLVVCISRLVPQKGIHLIRGAVHHTVAAGGQCVVLGSGHADGDFRAMAETDFKDSDAAKMMIMYSEPLAHMLYAAADFVIVPSLFEPCGLTQMIAMRYGALPIVRRTGGLADTVFDISSGDRGANGVVFDGADEGACNAAVDRAFALFRDSPEKFSELSKRNMDSDMSWNKSAEEYHDLYRRVRAI